MKRDVADPWALGIAKRLDAVGYTRRQFANLVNISEEYLSKLLCGNLKASGRLIFRIEAALSDLETEMPFFYGIDRLEAEIVNLKKLIGGISDSFARLKFFYNGGRKNAEE